MKVLVSKLIEEALEYWPKIIFCNDMQLFGDDCAMIPYLNDYDSLLDKLDKNIKRDDLLPMLLYCICAGFHKKAIEIYKANGCCPFVHQRDLDLAYIVDRIKEHMRLQDWRSVAKQADIKIIYNIKSTQKLDNINTKS